MKSNYRRIGDFIRQVNAKNTDGKIDQLLGINIDKFFMPSVANIVGTDLTKYKVVKHNQFACNRMHVGRDYRIPIALSQSATPFIVSPAYTVFEILDTLELYPEYLMMWFSRAEFDREAWFHTDADVRGGLPWELFCDIELPVPSIEKQKVIVKEYNIIVNRITLNEQLNQKLEETAQAIYKQWFVDFEFPISEADIERSRDGSEQDLEESLLGKPYKSSGGKMIWNEELEKEIPEGWEIQPLNNICDITSSKRIFESEYTLEGVPFYRGKEITQKKQGKVISEPIFISQHRYDELVNKYGVPSIGDILMTAVGTIGSTYMVQDERFYFKDGNVIWFKDFNRNGLNYFLYDFMQSDLFFKLINEITIGSTQNAITIKSFGEKKIVYPEENLLEKYKELIKKLYKNNSITKKQNIQLINLLNLFLSKLTTIEN